MLPVKRKHVDACSIALVYASALLLTVFALCGGEPASERQRCRVGSSGLLVDIRARYFGSSCSRILGSGRLTRGSVV